MAWRCGQATPIPSIADWVNIQGRFNRRSRDDFLCLRNVILFLHILIFLVGQNNYISWRHIMLFYLRYIHDVINFIFYHFGLSETELNVIKINPLSRAPPGSATGRNKRVHIMGWFESCWRKERCAPAFNLTIEIK